MRFLFHPPVLLLPSLLLPSLSLAAEAYSPKFAREQQPALMLAFDLCPKPEYPRVSLRNEEQGTVVYRFTIGADGRVLNQQVVRSSGYRNLDQASQETLSQCYFRPASIKGRPVQSTLDMQYVWVLE